MSFVTQEDVLQLLEELYTSLAKAVKPELKVVKPFPRLTYADVMLRYASEKPDLRYGLEIADITTIAAKTDFTVFKNAIAGGGVVRVMAAPGCGEYTRHQLEELNQLAISAGGKGLLTISLGTPGRHLETLTQDMIKSVAAKFMTLEQVKEMAGR